MSVGIDVSSTRGCPYAALDQDGGPIGAGWLATTTPSEAARAFRLVVKALARDVGPVTVGIDAPRQPLVRPRDHYWAGRAGWRPRRSSDRGAGRHCEVVVAAFGLATPQWTPLKSGCPKWMEYGFALFDAVGDIATTDEVFPSATYRQVEADPEARLTISLADLHLGPKDMLDAYLAAYTVRELGEGRGVEVGGGDGLGTIALARPLGIGPAGVLAWPTERPTPVPR